MKFFLKICIYCLLSIPIYFGLFYAAEVMCNLISECSKCHHIVIEALSRGEIVHFDSSFLEDLKHIFYSPIPKSISYIRQPSALLKISQDFISISITGLTIAFTVSLIARRNEPSNNAKV